jgi:hypothetical protein
MNLGAPRAAFTRGVFDFGLARIGDAGTDGTFSILSGYLVELLSESRELLL